MENKKTILILVHVKYINAKNYILSTGNNIVEYVRHKQIEHVLVLNDLHGGNKPVILHRKYKAGKEIEAKLLYSYLSRRSLFIRSIQELICTYRVVRYLKHVDMFIGIDPLNGFYGVILKKILNISQVITYTADYAEKRFSNTFINSIYHMIDRYSATQSDESWAVSKRIIEIRTSQGISKKKLFHIPNISYNDKIKNVRYTKDVRFKFVMATTQISNIDFEICFEVLHEVIKRYRNLELAVIGVKKGSTIYQEKLKKLNLEKCVTFYSARKREEFLNFIAKQGVGIALYANDCPWRYYSDSMKARDYILCGLPVIITSNVGTAADIKHYGAGYSINLSKKEFKNAIIKIIKSENQYLKLKKRVLEMKKKTSIESTLSNRILIN